MDLNTVKAITEATNTIKAEPVTPEPQQIEKFTQMLKSPETRDMDQSMVQAIRDKSLQIDSNFTKLHMDSFDQVSPEKILSSQLNIVKAVVEVELVAKTAGSASQSVNKLVSMQ
ncbi:type III secretion system inner rod subunit SctI [Dongshaea marina]|uniref:type III secretion system inner rod subunit SctI n=1 Tax=Dongshaea marina TaxID=2047966 RepID=UPI000D3EA16F|nr:type III secretion system inner rod subunit SctI [Dongshaea marina]